MHQVRDQTLPGPGLILGHNTFKDNIGSNFYSKVNNQNLPSFNLIQNTMHTPSARDPNYQLMHSNDQVLNPYRVGLDLNIQGEFNSRPAVPQFSTRS